MQSFVARSLAPTLAIAAVLALSATASASAADPITIGPGSCIMQTSAGVSAATGSALYSSLGDPATGLPPVEIATRCTAPLAQPLGIFAPITSPYGTRVHPITGAVTMHWGTDFSRSGIASSNIRSIAAGTVSARVESYATSGTGNMVSVTHADGVRSTYMHMVGPTPLGIGSRVEVGDILGQVGTTGGSTGPHLHLEIKINGTNVDPAAYLANSPILR